MYRFTNGIVCYDIITRDKYIEAGMILIEEEPKKEEKKIAKSETNSRPKQNEFGQTRKRIDKFSRSFK